MNQTTLTAAVTAGGLFFGVSVWLMPSVMQDAKSAVQCDASRGVERARRLLHEYDATLPFNVMILNALDDEGISIDTDDMSDDLADDYQEIHESIWDAYRPSDFRGDSVRPASAAYGRIAGDIDQGIREQDRFIEDNDRLLGNAMVAIQQALALSVGSESSRSYAEANRLKGVIQYHQGQRDRSAAQVLRVEVDRQRAMLIGFARSVAQLETGQSPAQNEALDETESALSAGLTEVERLLADDRARLRDVDGRVADLSKRLADARQRRDTARQAMKTLRLSGADLGDPNGIERFRMEMTKQDKTYRDAAREAHALEFGAYTSARLDFPGEYLTARFVEDRPTSVLSREFGLVHFRQEQAVLSATMEARQNRRDGLQTAIDQIAGVRASQQATRRATDKQMRRAIALGGETYDRLRKLDSEAFAAEEDALLLFDQAAKSFSQAARNTDAWISEAQQATQGLSPEARDRSALAARTSDGWMSGHIAAQEADARLARAWIYADRYRAYEDQATSLATVADRLQLAEADAEAEQAKSRNSRDAAAEEVEAAMEALRRAHRKAPEGNWTFTAQGAGVTYLMTLLGYDAYLPEAIEGYRKALLGRETEPYAKVFSKRLAELEDR